MDFTLDIPKTTGPAIEVKHRFTVPISLIFQYLNTGYESVKVKLTLYQDL